MKTFTIDLKIAVAIISVSHLEQLAPRGIRVNAVSPGPIAPPFHSNLGLREAQLSNAVVAIQMQVPRKRFGEASEITRATLFLASDDALFITGAEVVADGGVAQF